MKMLSSKKAQGDNIQGFILSIVGVAVVLAVGLIVLAELQNSTTAGTLAYNSTGTIMEKLGTVPVWIGILIVVALAFIVLSFFGRR